MTTPFGEIIREHCRPLEPIPTSVEPQLKPLPGARAVLFDVYGTLLVSGIGEVGTVGTDTQSRAFREAFESLGIDVGNSAEVGVQVLIETIAAHRVAMIDDGITTPDVDIVDVWQDTLDEMDMTGLLDTDVDKIDISTLAIEYECRANPVWPMPLAAECLDSLSNSGMDVGIISNAQFFTLPILSALFDATIDEVGFDSDLRFLSYDRHWAKPDPHLYELACDELRKRGITPEETVFVGNDLLNDVTPARAVGFRTALFAGDQRSLRMRTGDERVDGVTPDVIITDFRQLTECLTEV